MIHRRPRLHIANDFGLLAEACKSLLEPEFEVVGIAQDGHQLREGAMQLMPDVAILDVFLQGLDGLQVGAQIKQKLPSVKLVYMTQCIESEPARVAFRIGASAYLVRTTASELLLAIRKVLGGERYISPSINVDIAEFTGPLAVQTQQRRPTHRQSQVLQLLAEGMSMKEAAGILKVTPRTIAYHKYNMMEEIGIKTNADLMKYAFTNHFAALNS